MPARRLGARATVAAAFLIPMTLLGQAGAATPSAHLTVLDSARAGGTLTAVVAVPTPLTGMTLPQSAWSVRLGGRALTPTTTRLVDGQLRLTLVVDRSVTQPVLASEQGTAAELLHQLPGTSSAGITTGAGISGQTVSGVLPMLGRLTVGQQPSLAQQLSAALRAAAPQPIDRRAVVVVAPCQSLAGLDDTIAGAPSATEVDVVGIGGGCPADAVSRVAGTGGLVAAASGSADQLTAAADRIAARLLGEYAVTVAAAEHSVVQLTVTANGIVATGAIAASGTSTAPGSTGRGTSVGDQGGTWSGGAGVVRGIAIAVVVAMVVALAVYRRRYASGRAVTTTLSR